MLLPPWAGMHFLGQVMLTAISRINHQNKIQIVECSAAAAHRCCGKWLKWRKTNFTGLFIRLSFGKNAAWTSSEAANNCLNLTVTSRCLYWCVCGAAVLCEAATDWPLGSGADSLWLWQTAGGDVVDGPALTHSSSFSEHSAARECLEVWLEWAA